MSLKTKLLEHRRLNCLASEVICSQEESEQYKKLVQSGHGLPNGVYRKVEKDKDYFYTIADDQSELTHEETMELIGLMQLEKISTIKSCCVFFTILAIVGLVAALFCFMYARSLMGV